MASKGEIEAILNTLDPEIRKPLSDAFRVVLDRFQLGQPDEGKRATNFQWYLRSSTTASVANTEFSIAHGLGVAPIAVYPALFLDQVGAQLVPLTVSRAADASRVYLKSTSTSAAFSVWLEA